MKKISILIAAVLGFVLHASAQTISDEQFSTMMDSYLKSEKGKTAFAGALEDYAKRKQYEAQEAQFKNPVKIDVGNSPAKGPAGAKITIIEFSDFQCPFCKRGRDTMNEVMKLYPNDVKLVFKHYPLPFHKDAKPAAKAAYAAGKQGKFWEMHDLLFDNQQNFGKPDFFAEQAAKLNLNAEQFKNDMASPEAEAAVTADEQVGKKNGVEGTPGFFVNGVPVKGAYPADYFKSIIDRLLAEAKGGAPAV